MKLIDADMLFDAMEETEWYNNADRDEIAERLVMDAPSIDIVRCGECKWLRYCETEEMESFLDCDHPDGGGIPRNEEWFCADGERKDDE